MTIDELRALGKVPRVHGNGFIQLDLNEEGTKRLHVWHEDIPRQVVATPIHDHVFNINSTVLCGTLVHEELMCANNQLNGTHRVYHAEQEQGSQNTILVPDEGTVSLYRLQLLILAPGSQYIFPAGKLHQSDHYGLTATIMNKMNAPKNYGRPRVLVPIGSKPDNDFHRDGFDSRMLWDYIGEALDVSEVLDGP